MNKVSAVILALAVLGAVFAFTQKTEAPADVQETIGSATSTVVAE